MYLSRCIILLGIAFYCFLFCFSTYFSGMTHSRRMFYSIGNTRHPCLIPNHCETSHFTIIYHSCSIFWGDHSLLNWKGHYSSLRRVYVMSELIILSMECSVSVETIQPFILLVWIILIVLWMLDDSYSGVSYLLATFRLLLINWFILSIFCLELLIYNMFMRNYYVFMRMICLYLPLCIWCWYQSYWGFIKRIAMCSSFFHYLENFMWYCCH